MSSAHLPTNANHGCLTQGFIADKGHAVDETQIAPSPFGRDIAEGIKIAKVSIPATTARVSFELLGTKVSVQFSCTAKSDQSTQNNVDDSECLSARWRCVDIGLGSPVSHTSGTVDA